MTNREITHKDHDLERFVSKKRILSGITISVIVGVLLGFLAPFGMDQISVGYSIFYWVTTCVLGYCIYFPIYYFGDKILAKAITTHWIRVAISTLPASVLMTFVVIILNGLFFSDEILFQIHFLFAFPKVLLIGAVLTVISIIQEYIKHQKKELIRQQKHNEQLQQQTLVATNQQISKFLDMLPIDKRGQLQCLEMSDHYVKVYTENGHHLLLMRFKDAIESLADYPGIQTHRSWWVATEVVASVKKDGRKLTLVLKNGLEVPVSRTYTGALKSANIY